MRSQSSSFSSSFSVVFRYRTKHTTEDEDDHEDDGRRFMESPGQQPVDDDGDDYGGRMPNKLFAS